MSVEDLAKYSVEIRELISGDYRGYEIVSMPPPGSGGTSSTISAPSGGSLDEVRPACRPRTRLLRLRDGRPGVGRRNYRKIVKHIVIRAEHVVNERDMQKLASSSSTNPARNIFRVRSIWFRW